MNLKELIAEIENRIQLAIVLSIFAPVLISTFTLAGDPDLKKAGIDIKEFVKELTKRIRHDLAIDWTNNETIKARIRQNVRLLLLQRGFVEQVQTERLIESIYQETVRVYREYLPVAA